MRYVNLGCGARHHPDWTNFDLVPAGPGVVACDLTRGIPLPDAQCDAVYHSHVLEHLRPDDALPFLRECRRILKPGGVLRVVVPDLEQACREYLRTLEVARAGGTDAAADCEWMTVELLDQLVRERSGGRMLDYVRRSPPNAAYVRARLGDDADQILDAQRQEAQQPWRAGARKALAAARAACDRLAGIVLLRADAARALAIGGFRLSGEAHQWMYDAYSLDRLLLEAGFQSPAVRTAEASGIAGWARFHLDAAPDGCVRRPNSLYMEAASPA